MSKAGNIDVIHHVLNMLKQTLKGATGPGAKPIAQVESALQKLEKDAGSYQTIGSK